MSAEQFAALVGLVVGYSFVFDAIDLQPQVGSFAFLRGIIYWLYLAFRSVLGVLAGLVIFQASPGLALPIGALIAVLTSVTVLQNFSLNIGGNDIAKLSNLVDNYKSRMVAEEAARLAKRNESAALQVQEEMIEAFSPSELENSLRQMLLQAGWPGDKINSHVEKLRQIAGDNPRYLEAMIAFQVADMNLEHTRFLVSAQHRCRASEPAGQIGAPGA